MNEYMRKKILKADKIGKVYFTYEDIVEDLKWQYPEIYKEIINSYMGV